jgi:transposase InsO family protein
MSKARLVITAVTVEKRPVSEVAKSYGVARSWVYTLLARYRAEGEAAFEPRSRRPKTSPGVTAPGTVELITRLRKELTGQGLDAGPQTIARHLQQHHQVKVSPATVSRCLARQGLVTPDPSKRPKSSYIRFAAEQPNECWQSDFTHYFLADGAGAEILAWLDDQSRMALSVTAYHAVTGADVVASFRAAVAACGPPASTLTGNGMVYTSRVSGGSDSFEHELRRLGITQKNGKPNHPQSQAKVQRFQQTLKKWLFAQPVQPETVADLQALLDSFTAYYNQQRPHRSLGGATPATAYVARPKATPSARVDGTPDCVRAGHVGKTGTITMRPDGHLHHIGIGRQHAGAPIVLRVQDSQIRIIHARTGELLRDLILDQRGDTREQHRGAIRSWVSAMLPVSLRPPSLPGQP